jgi:hypothetical protein
MLSNYKYECDEEIWMEFPQNVVKMFWIYLKCMSPYKMYYCKAQNKMLKNEMAIKLITIRRHKILLHTSCRPFAGI